MVNWAVLCLPSDASEESKEFGQVLIFNNLQPKLLNLFLFGLCVCVWIILILCLVTSKKDYHLKVWVLRLRNKNNSFKHAFTELWKWYWRKKKKKRPLLSQMAVATRLPCSQERNQIIILLCAYLDHAGGIREDGSTSDVYLQTNMQINEMYQLCYIICCKIQYTAQGWRPIIQRLWKCSMWA